MLAAPAAAETTNNSAPRAQATSNNTNQSVQFNNNGAPSRQHFGGNVSCNGPTLVVTPFHLEAHADPIPSEDYTRAQNFGAQLSINIPLDGSITEMCKAMVRRKLAAQQQQIEKEKLDYHLVRALKCAELYKTGFMLHPDSTLGSTLCSDVVSIDVYRKSQGLSPVVLPASSAPSETQASVPSRDSERQESRPQKPLPPLPPSLQPQSPPQESATQTPETSPAQSPSVAEPQPSQSQAD